MHILFFSRLVLYLIALCIPVFHPSIVVPYDLNGWILWFVLIPGEMVIARYAVPPRVKPGFTAVAGLALIGAALIITAGGSLMLPLLGGGVAAFLLTLLIFNTGILGKNIAVLEQFFIAFIYYKLLTFSRASEEIAWAGSGITQILLVLIVCSFITHGLILYFAAFRSKEKKRIRREVALLALLAPALLVLALMLPPDFIEHSIVFNPIDEDVPQPFDESSRKGWPREGEGDEEDAEQENGENGEEGELQGIPSDKWSERLSEKSAKGKQYAVMLVISTVDPVYSAGGYYSNLHPKRGFLYDREQELNDLAYLRLLETWRNEEEVKDRFRFPVDVRYMSTLSTRVLQYRPSVIEPTVLTMQYHPFDYTYHAVSGVSMTGPAEWKQLEGLSSVEKQEVREYLEVPEDLERRELFEQFLSDAFGNREPAELGVYAKMNAILRSFTDFQYELGFDDSVHIEKLAAFLEETRSGDCTEFSNTTAVLARLAGVPARVVTGYLASGSLQSPAHQWGIQELRKVLPPLREYPLDEVFLVTTAHRHSWVQVYFPEYGWIDFESTSFAIPPPPGADPNSRNVVIPIIEDISREEDVFTFPWQFVIKVFLIAAFVIVAGLYITRAAKQSIYALQSRGNDRKALTALYKLLLMKKAADGYRLRAPFETPREYAEQYPELASFADLYTRLRYKEAFREGENEALRKQLREEYRLAAARKKKGLLGLLRRIFNVKGLYY